MQSSMVVAGMDALSESCENIFDTSGKSAALFYPRATCKTPMALPDNGLFGAIAGKKSLPTIEVAPARHSEGSPLALPSRARSPCASPRRYRREPSSRPQHGNGTGLGAPARGNHSLHGYSTVGGGDGKRATQGQDPLPHSDQAEAKLVVRAQSAAIVAYTYPGAPTAVAPYPGKLPAGFDGHADGCRAGVAKHICQSFLNGTVNRQIGRLAGLTERRRNRGFDDHTRMRLAPQPQQSIERLAKAKFR